jgi:hypothetical protein
VRKFQRQQREEAEASYNHDVDGNAFMKAVEVWRRRKDCQEVVLGELTLLASVADRFQTTEVTSVLEEAVMG